MRLAVNDAIQALRALCTSARKASQDFLEGRGEEGGRVLHSEEQWLAEHREAMQISISCLETHHLLDLHMFCDSTG